MKQRHLTNLLALSMVALLFSACAKTSDEPSTPTVVNPPVVNPPVVVVPDYTIWKLNNIMINQAPMTLTALQASFRMTMYNDGRYADTDGAAGTWALLASDSLSINKMNLPKPITSRYKAISQSKTSLVLFTTQENTEIKLTYEAN